MTATTDKTAPKLISNLPTKTNNLGQNLVFTFNESIKIGTGNIVIQYGKTKQVIPVSNSQVTIDGATLTINPTNDFLANTHYTIQIPKTAITDLSGNKFAGKNLTFDTDTLAPTIKAHTPASNKKLVATNSNVTFTFNEKIQAGNGNVVLKDDLGNELKIPISSSEITIKGTTLTVNPAKNLDGKTLYTVSLDAGVVKDLANNAIGTSNSFSFTTKNVADKIAPTLNTFSPSDNATKVAINSDLKLTFSETIKAGTGNIIISNGTDIRTISITDSTQITHDFNVLTINPKLDLLAGSNYSVTFTSGVITDKTGNSFAGITDATTFNFSTVPQTTGKLVDGYIKGATVFADANNDGILQKETESWTTSDDNGNFVLTNPVGTIVMLGDGIDILSGKSFTQIMKAPAGSTVVTPATTVMQHLIDAGKTEAEAQVLTLQTLGLPTTTDLKTSDPIANFNNAITNDEKIAAAKELSTSVQLANAYLSGGSATMTTLTSRITEGNSTPIDLTSKTVLESLGVLATDIEKIASSNTSINNATADELSSAIQTELSTAKKATVTYSSTTFVETLANDGSLSTGIILTLVDDKFSGAVNTPLSGVSVVNVPTGLTATVTKTSDTTALLTLAGNAASHLNANDISNLSVILSDASFTDVKAVNVTGANTSGFSIDFADQPVLTYSTTSFSETAASNNGAIATAVTVSLIGDSFSDSLSGNVSFSGVPNGLTANLTKIDGTHATLTLIGNATNHENDINNLTMTFGAGSFTNTRGAVTDSTKTFSIDFLENIPVDITPPSVSATSASLITNEDSISVTSTESGIVYLVNELLTPPASSLALASLEASNDTRVNHMSISANTSTNFSLAGLQNGIYKVYAVDAVGNLSSAATNQITIGMSVDSLVTTIQQPLSTDASNTTLVLLESVTISDYVRVTGFGADDSIYIPDLGANHLVVESHGTDVIFTVNSGGIVSQITLIGVNDNHSIITSVDAFNTLAVGNILFPVA